MSSAAAVDPPAAAAATPATDAASTVAPSTSAPTDGSHAAATLSAKDDADTDAASDDGELVEAADDPAASPVNPLSDSDSDSEAEEGAADDDVQLGFLEDAEHPRAMLRTYFPAKVGGKPAWLNPRVLPSCAQLTCAYCSNPMVFLMQLYAPLRETYGAHAGSFHRTLFLFVCLEEKCSTLQRSVLCFRSQLPRHNPFYPSEAPAKLPIYELEKGEQTMPVLEDPAEAGVHLCCVCGNPAPSSCSRCHSRRYCSKLHQLFDWKQGKHKSLCVPKGTADSAAASSAAAASSSPAAPSLLFPQKEVVIEPENSDDEDESDDDDETNGANAAAGSASSSGAATKPADKQKQQKQKKKSGKGADDYSKEHQLLDAYKASKASESAAGADAEDDDDVEETVTNWSSPKLKDPVFNRFKARTARHPEQVLRYDRAPDADPLHSHQPLWVSTWFQPGSEPLPASALAPQVAGQPAPARPKPVAPTRAQNDAAIPACGSCGGARRFEFQVLPQLLYYLGPLGSSLDFANLAVYTCEHSCGEGRAEEGYKEEFVWVQAHAQ